MSLNEQYAFPTAEESDAYFKELQALEPIQHTFARRALVLTEAPEVKIDTDSIAEVNKDTPAIIAFADGVSVENREAVMLGVELAEVVANQKADINKDPVLWLETYAKAFRFAGWLTTGGHQYGEYTSTNVNLTMDSMVLELISAVAGTNAQIVIKLLNLVMDKIQKDERMMTLFDRNRKSGTSSSFRIMPCLESSKGIPVTYLLAVHCESSTDSGGALFWKWSVSKMNVKYLAKGVTFSQGTHDRNKQQILGHLGKSADDFFESLK
ncbi:hypothetical protein CFII64_20463 [Pseudomonas sp. CFII64]|uniref:hypothetical protein n=1 Tax=Pseudomonas sp. CFII64 TaxID=911242 RepID=UPI0003578ABF|nr:hypothetical protein [Pseudomonas sp. CFII64]EPJ79629.1 hypothetical protein CFII64_20463 [Pseudomonas sp. CFII64]